MKCGGKKKARKFAEGGWSTSVSFDEADAKRRADEWANKQAAERAAKAKPKPKMEEVTVTASRLTPKNDKAPLAPPPRRGPSDKEVQTVANVFNRKPRKRSFYQESIDKADRYFRGLRSGPSMKAYAKGGKVRGDGCATKGRTKGRHC